MQKKAITTIMKRMKTIHLVGRYTATARLMPIASPTIRTRPASSRRAREAGAAGKFMAVYHIWLTYGVRFFSLGSQELPGQSGNFPNPQQ